MRLTVKCIISLGMLVSGCWAVPITVSATASFNGGLLGAANAWSFQYVSGAPGLNLSGITIDLSPTALRFDTAAGGFGSLGNTDVGSFGGSDVTTGLSAISATGGAIDGGQLLTFSFLDFTPGENFQFVADVDHPDPALVALRNCSALTGLAATVCNAQNLAANATNATRLVAADSVSSNAMANAKITMTFSGTGYDTFSVTGTFQTVTLLQIIQGLAGGQGTGAFGNTASIQNPEPESLILMGAGLGLMALAMIKRKR
jgi:hypothetical protein